MKLNPGDEVVVLLENGYRSTGIVLRLFKNGRYGVRESNGKYYVRCASNLSKKKGKKK